jgi:GR25 family glycosyltransferase involved in LPS biosynthesis
MSFQISPNTKLYYINLDKNEDRNNNIKNLISKFGFINSFRLSAISTKTQDEINTYKKYITNEAYDKLQINNIKKSRDNHYELSNGAVGCYLSHMEIYKDMIKNNIPYAIILEDDCVINNTKEQFWEKVSKINIPNDTDICLMHGIIYDNSLTKNENINKVDFFLCLHFYVVTLEGAKKLVNSLLPIEMQIDSKISRLAYDKKLNLYCYNKKDLGIIQAKMGTDIQVNTCPKCNIRNEIIRYKNKTVEGFEVSNNNGLLILIVIIAIMIIILYKN